MPIEIPSESTVSNNAQTYVRATGIGLDPSTKRRSFIGAMVTSFARAVHDFYVYAKRFFDFEIHPQTATGDWLYDGWWTAITELSRNPASAATGTIVITGTAGGIIDAGDELEANATTYTVNEAATIVAQSLTITSLTRSGTTAIVETSASPHNLATGMTVTIAGADQAAYNGAVVITATAANEFTYTVSGSPTTPATGTVTASATYANARVTADITGTDGNISSGATMTITAPNSGVDDEALVCFGGVSGGAEIEDKEAFRARLIEALAVDFGTFSASEIKIVAKQISGVTRVWVREATLNASNGVAEGQVEIYFTRDNDANIFPSAADVATVKAHIVSSIMPAHTAEEDVTVAAPTALPVDFTFTALSPDTPSMRAAVEAALVQFFDEGVDLGIDVTEDAYRCAIYAAYDLDRQAVIKSFALSTPSAGITVDTDELPTLGTVTWSIA